MPMKEGKGGHGLQSYSSIDGRFGEDEISLGGLSIRKKKPQETSASVGKSGGVTGTMSPKAKKFIDEALSGLDIIAKIREQVRLPQEFEKKPLSYYLDTDSSELNTAALKEAVKKLRAHYESKYKNGEVSYKLNWQFDDPRVEYAMIKWALKLQEKFPMLVNPFDPSKRSVAQNDFLSIENETPHSRGEMGCCYVLTGKLNISKKYMNNKPYSSIVDQVNEQIASGWWIKASGNDNIIAETLCHEYGHAFFNNMTGTRVGSSVPYEKRMSEQQICEEIEAIAKTKNPDFELTVGTSGYPRSYLSPKVGKKTSGFYAEFLAETFASMTCGESTEASDAMRLFIKENYGL